MYRCTMCGGCFHDEEGTKSVDLVAVLRKVEGLADLQDKVTEATEITCACCATQKQRYDSAKEKRSAG